ncbi:NucA/NucB deoxyribonuclease domain-containing protein [Kitasatospora sp. NPDC049258]|uniref:NucA/NucB deoxyribonuclease domain-containing protein n=1 Tax=Kitasatospora sp. NPDC049258 TaxID=3155394 RepID=UPI003425FC7E
MSHPIAKALEDAAQRVGRTISKDAAKAVSEMYEQAGQGAKQVVKNLTDADDAHAKQILALAEKIAKNDGMTGKGARKRMVRQHDARTRIAGHLGVRGDYDAEMVIDSSRYPESAQHIQEAQNGTVWRGGASAQGRPRPSVLTIDRDNADSNRADSLRGIPTAPPQDRDEYPPAMFKEGGKGASVKYIADSDNRGSGSAMGSALHGLPKGARVRIRIR